MGRNGSIIHLANFDSNIFQIVEGPGFCRLVLRVFTIVEASTNELPLFVLGALDSEAKSVEVLVGVAFGWQIIYKFD